MQNDTTGKFTTKKCCCVQNNIYHVVYNKVLCKKMFVCLYGIVVQEKVLLINNETYFFQSY